MPLPPVLVERILTDIVSGLPLVPMPAEPPINVAVDPAARGTAQQRYTTTATLEAENRAQLLARTSGVVAQLLVDEGTAVKLGQPLLRLDDSELKLRVRRGAGGHDERGEGEGGGVVWLPLHRSLVGRIKIRITIKSKSRWCRAAHNLNRNLALNPAPVGYIRASDRSISWIAR